MSDVINRCLAHCRSKGGVVNSHFSHLQVAGLFPATLHNFTMRVSPDPLSLREGLARETTSVIPGMCGVGSLEVGLLECQEQVVSHTHRGQFHLLKRAGQISSHCS